MKKRQIYEHMDFSGFLLQVEKRVSFSLFEIGIRNDGLKRKRKWATKTDLQAESHIVLYGA